jgi:glyoxylase-like metal-dependent hydrolase (beta-lactamase superfamily II)
MKNRIALSIITLACLAAALLAVDCRGADPVSTSAPKKGSWFTARKVGNQTRLIDDHGNANMYLVEGTKAALLVDTGTGQRDLAAYVAGLTTLPVLVVNTHGHGDHAGGNYGFTKVYAHAADFGMIRSMRGPIPELVEVKEGFVIDLGGRSLEVIETPGHTPGSIVLLDAANKMLFAGDNNNSQVWLFLPESLPLETYLKSQEKLNRRAAQFDMVFPGHNDPLPGSFVAEEIECAQTILKGECSGTAYRPYQNAFLCNYKSAGIVFDPRKLRKP